MPDTETGALSAAARELALLAGDHAARQDEERRLDPDVMKAVVAGGFARHFVPRVHGGTGGTFAELNEALTTVAASCAATAWSASIVAGVGRMAGFLPAEGSARLWKDGPDTVVVGSLAPLGRASAAPGGWTLSGTWPSISVVDHCDWALLRAVIPAGEGTALRVFAVPRSAFGVKDTWASTGMRATGSNTVVVEEAFVPDELTFAGEDLFQGRPCHSTELFHTVPLQAVNGLFFAGPALGAARGALAHWSGYATEKFRKAPPAAGPQGLSRSVYAEALARSSGELDAAGLLIERAASVADRGADVTALEAARNGRDCSLSVQMAVSSVNRVFAAAGTGGHSTHSPLQRFWRDVNSAATHIGLQFEPAAHAYAEQVARSVS
ncbi:hydrolase [Streptomyces sp. RerS4]|uniref:hydrolase n=1 Tax=Streptomyces sp. RerS4 TaxID=2942449 RepID=UPI00201CA748|nr:hydrolase [Streptomyces sp. RerS4]UQX05465.1 hydrolase [Streptomyces sp. RerS4]